VEDPGAVALSIFGAITVTGLSVAVDGSSNDSATDAARIAASICDLMLNGLATTPASPEGDR
jgi:hypothetical protein